nr:FecR domain-containing protein [uncultured Rhodoferax sp.]
MPPPPPPMDINDWWLAAAAAAATGLLPPSASAATPQAGQVGIASAVRPGVTSASNERVVYIGNAVAFGERFQTDSTGVLHILFMDRSSMTLGPNSELVIDEFVFRPEQQQGNIAVNLLKGTLRAVGGFISKYTLPGGKSAAQVRSPTATIGIRGGITMLEATPSQTNAVFLFGDEMRVTSLNGQQFQSVTRPGFGVIAGPNGVGAPFRIPSSDMANWVNQFGVQQTGQPQGGTGNLISTNDRPGGLGSANSSLAPDRTQQTRTNIDTNAPGDALRNLLGSDSTQVRS